MAAPSLLTTAALAAAVGVGLILFIRKGAAGQLAAGAVGAVADAGAGAVLGVGDVVGIPRTSKSQCDADLAAGRLWDASFSCPAGTFIGGVWDSIIGDDGGDKFLTDAQAIAARNAYAQTDPRRVDQGGYTGSW